MSPGVSGGGAVGSPGGGMGPRGGNCMAGWACAADPPAMTRATSNAARVRMGLSTVMPPPGIEAWAATLFAAGGEDLIKAPEQVLRLLDCRLTLTDPQRQCVALAPDGFDLLLREAEFALGFVGADHGGATREPRGRSDDRPGGANRGGFAVSARVWTCSFRSRPPPGSRRRGLRGRPVSRGPWPSL